MARAAQLPKIWHYSLPIIFHHSLQDVTNKNGPNTQGCFDVIGAGVFYRCCWLLQLCPAACLLLTCSLGSSANPAVTALIHA
jgi:hypothetical protein